MQADFALHEHKRSEGNLGRERVKTADAKQFPVATKLDEKTYKRFTGIADYKDLTSSQLLRIAIKEFMDRFEEARRPKRSAAA